MDLEPIKARLAAATPGPWFHRQAGEHRPSDPKQRYDWIGDHPEQGKHKKVIVGREVVYGGTPDYAFIAAAPTDIAALIARVEELEAECFALSAGVCPHKLGNEHGNAYCGKTNELI